MDATSGVGIGLTNAKILTEALGGQIKITSKPDHGTDVTFSVDLNFKT